MNRARRPGESLMVVEQHLQACGRKPGVDDVRFPGNFEVVAAFAGPNGSPESTGRLRVRRHAIRQAAVLEVSGRLSDVVHDLDQAIQLALADWRGPCQSACSDPRPPGWPRLVRSDEGRRLAWFQPPGEGNHAARIRERT